MPPPRHPDERISICRRRHPDERIFRYPLQALQLTPIASALACARGVSLITRGRDCVAGGMWEVVHDRKPFSRYFGRHTGRNFGQNVMVKYSSFRLRPLQSITAKRRSYSQIISFGGCFGEKLTSFGPFWCTGRYTGIGQNWDLPFGGLSVSAER